MTADTPERHPMPGQPVAGANGELLRLTSAKKDKLENDLEKAWIAHVLVAGIGIAMVFNVGSVAESVLGRFLQGNYDLKTVAAIILAIYLYYFMRTGPLLTAFNEAKALQDKQLEGYLTGQPKAGTTDPKVDPLHPLHGTTSFLAAAFYSRAKGVPYFIITALVVSLAQASALFLVVKAYNASAMISMVIALSLMIALYFLFWQRQKDHARATCAVVVLCLLVPLWFFSFKKLAPDNHPNKRVDQRGSAPPEQPRNADPGGTSARVVEGAACFPRTPI